MPLVVIERAGASAITAAAPEGGSLADLCDDVDAPVPFACRDANCGTCRIDVLEGAAELEPAGPEERAVLTRLACPASYRLACCAQMRAERAGGALLRVRVVTP
jgi:2Fe-2S ferredoxin